MVAAARPGLAGEMIDDLDERMGERKRSIEEALTDLRAKYKINPTPELARMIRQLEAEIADRKRPPELPALQFEKSHRSERDGNRHEL
jgi:hypothetical protein